MGKDILFISHIMSNMDPSDNDRFTYLARQLQNNGNNVEVVTSDFFHADKIFRDTESIKSKWTFKITFLHENRYKKNFSFKRIFSHLFFAYKLSNYLKRRKKPDVIYLAFPPISSSKIVAKYCKKNKLQYLVDIQDLWPESFGIKLGTNWLVQLLMSPLKRCENYVFANASMVAGVSTEYMNRGLSVNKKHKTGFSIYLGTDGSRVENALRNFTKKSDSHYFHIAYCGNLGRSYDFINVFKALAFLSNKGYQNLVLEIFGSGEMEENLKKMAALYFKNTNFYGYLPYDEMLRKLSLCDVALNPIVRSSRSSIVNKVGDYAAVGIPVVNSQNDAEYRQLVDEYKCGLNAICEDYLDIARKIAFLYDNEHFRKLAGKNNKILFFEKFDRRNTYKAIENWLESK